MILLIINEKHIKTKGICQMVKKKARYLDGFPQELRPSGEGLSNDNRRIGDWIPAFAGRTSRG
jgi:hypothetical protein